MTAAHRMRRAHQLPRAAFPPEELGDAQMHLHRIALAGAWRLTAAPASVVLLGQVHRLPVVVRSWCAPRREWRSAVGWVGAGVGVTGGR